MKTCFLYEYSWGRVPAAPPTTRQIFAAPKGAFVSENQLAVKPLLDVATSWPYLHMWETYDGENLIFPKREVVLLAERLSELPAARREEFLVECYKELQEAIAFISGCGVVHNFIRPHTLGFCRESGRAILCDWRYAISDVGRSREYFLAGEKCPYWSPTVGNPAHWKEWDVWALDVTFAFWRKKMRESS